MATYEPYRLTQTGAQVQQDLNDVEALGLATEETAGKMSAADKAKLDNLPSGSELSESLGGKVDKVPGKGLSENDYTDTDKQKVSNAYVKPQTGIPASDLNTLQLIGAPSSYGTQNEEWFAEHICSIADFIKMAQGEYLFAKGSSGDSSMGYDFIYHVAGATSHLLGIDAYSVEFYSGDNAIIVGYTPSQHTFTFYESRGVKPSDINAWNAKYSKPMTGIPASDLAADVIPDVTGKADKVSSPTAGNFAGLDSSGNITDSGSKASDFATAAQGAKADTAIQPSQTAGLLKNDGTVDTTAYGTYSKPAGGIPAADLASGVIPDVSGKENTSNKVTSLSSQSTDTQYPSAKCVYDLIGDVESLINAL